MKILYILISLFILTSCSSQKAFLQLDGNWSIIEAMGKSTATGEKQPFITFESGKVHGNASVNLFHGSYTLKGSHLTFSHMGMTMMMGRSMDVEAAITQAFEKTTRIACSKDQLYLLDAQKDTVMTLVKKP